MATLARLLVASAALRHFAGGHAVSVSVSDVPSATEILQKPLKTAVSPHTAPMRRELSRSPVEQSPRVVHLVHNKSGFALADGSMALLQVKGKAPPTDGVDAAPAGGFAAATSLPGQRTVLAFACTLVLLVGVAYRSQGPQGIGLLIMYIVAVIMCQLTMRRVMLSFPHPVFMTALHFLMSWVAILIPRDSWSSDYSHSSKEMVRVFWQPRRYFATIVPIGLAMFGTIVMNNSSLLYIGAGLNSLIGILTPLTTALLASALGYRIVGLAWCGMAVALFGDAVISLGEYQVLANVGGDVRAVMVGTILGGLAMLFRSTKAVLQDHLMNDYGPVLSECPRLKPLDIWALQAPLLAVLSFVVTAFTEGAAPWKEIRVLSYDTLGAIALSCVSAVVLNVGGTFVIKMLGAPAAQMAAKLSVLATAALAAAFMGEIMTATEMAGALIVVLGTGIFERFQRRAKHDWDALASKEKLLSDAAHLGAGAPALYGTSAAKYKR